MHKEVKFDDDLFRYVDIKFYLEYTNKSQLDPFQWFKKTSFDAKICTEEDFMKIADTDHKMEGK